MSALELVVTLAVLLLVVVAWRRVRDRRIQGDWERAQAPARRKQAMEGVDRAELEQAEREVREMDTDARGRPLDQGIGDDWGPGTPKPPYV